MLRSSRLWSVIVICLALGSVPFGAAHAQQPPAAPASPDSQAAPPAKPAQPEGVAPAPQRQAIEEVQPAEEPKASADTANAREVVLEARPVILFRGEATWDDGYETLMKAFKALREEAKRAGVAVVGRPLSVFIETNDLNFKYEAMVFVDKEPDPKTKFRTGTSAGQSPAGKAFVFKHVGAYDDIDSVYEAITAWLDEKGLTAKGAFLEEYMNEPQGSDDALLELQIYVFVE